MLHNSNVLVPFFLLFFHYSISAQILQTEQSIDLFSSSGQFVGANPFSYRIPALAVTNTGRILAVCDARYGTTADLPNDIDVVIRKSDDNGDTWTDRETILNSGFIGSGDPQIIIDKMTGDIFIFYAYAIAWTSPIQEIRYIKSSDDGDTWSEPINILSSVFDTDDINMWAGPGNGIQMRNGRLIAPYSLNSQGIQDSIQSCFIYSDDHGATWLRSTSASGTGLEEPTMIELNDGSLMLNARSRRGFARRGISYTDPDGLEWTSTIDHPDLLDPIVQGSMIRYTSVLDGYAKDRILFSNPRDESDRKNLTIHMSYDEGQTWQALKVLDPDGSAYSSIAILDNGDIGILYEKDYGPHGLLGIIYPNHISFARFTLDELTDGMDSLVMCGNPNAPIISDINANSSLITWNELAGTYDLEYKKTTDPDWTLISTVNSPYLLSNLDAETGYEVRLIWNCSSESVSSTAEVPFQTTMSTSITSLLLENLIEIKPNPSTGIIHLEFENEQKKDIEIQIIDIYGSVLYIDNMPVNTQNKILDLSYLSTGIYFVELKSNERKIVKKICIK